MARQAVIPRLQAMAPPFPADHISSLLYLPELLRPREQRQRGDPGRQPRARPGAPLDPGRHAHRQSGGRHLGELARQGVRGAQGAHGMAPCRDLQRAARRDRRKVPEKGSKVYLEGALQTRKWTDQGGQERYTTEIVLNRFRGELTMLDGAGGARGAGGPPMEGGYDEGYAGGGFGDEPT